MGGLLTVYVVLVLGLESGEKKKKKFDLELLKDLACGGHTET